MTVRFLSKNGPAHIEAVAQVCVVGAGIAGLFTACRLAEKGYKVGVLESGLRTFDPAIYDLNEVDDTFGVYGGARDGRYRGLGGSSSRWGGRMLPLTAHDACTRPYASIGAWPFDISELDIYRPEIERILQRRSRVLRGRRARRLRPPRRHPSRRSGFCVALCQMAELPALQPHQRDARPDRDG